MTPGARGAVFLDRDGVITANVFYEDTSSWEAPRTARDFRLLPTAVEAMKLLQAAGYPLFLVSNQPNQAKKKASRADHEEIHARLTAALQSAGVEFVEAFYCFHHPVGTDPALVGICECRKPSPFFLSSAQRRHGLDLSKSWMVGDRETDIACGHAAGARAVLIAPEAAAAPATAADHIAPDLLMAARHILAART